MKTAGIIGGLGPATTADFYLEINAMAEATNQANRPPCLIWNVPLDYELEHNLLVAGEGIEDYAPYLRSAAHMLEAAGADFLVVPCNTVHELYDDFSSAVDIPVLHIVGETAQHLRAESVGTVALLATGQTVGSRLYQDVLTDFDIACVTPDSDRQTRLNEVIARLVANHRLTQDADFVNGLVEEYMDTVGVGAVVLGCTDFHILLNSDTEGVVDSMHVLAQATFDKMMSES